MAEDWSELLKKDLSKLASIVVPGALKIEALREGERREVAVLFLDLKGFVALFEGLDHEDVHQIVNGIMQALSRVVEGHGGRVDKFEGDLIMALFGVKQATENDSIRAVSCGLKMLATIDDINQVLAPRNIKLGVRIGINYGWVTVGPDPSGHLTVTGDVVNLASRMESTAEVNTVQVAESVYQQCSDYFRWRDLGKLRVKGKTQPVQAYRPLGPGLKLKERWERASRLARSPLVGREQEFALLESYWRKRNAAPKKNRRGGVRHLIIDIPGEAGIGKSRLVHEFLSKLKSFAHPQPLILKGNTLSFAQPPFTLWTSLLRQFFDLSLAEKDARIKIESKLKKISQRLKDKTAAAALMNSFPFIAAMLSVPTNDTELEAIDDNIRHQQNLTALRNLLRVLQMDGAPVVLLLEDLQWIDEPSREALEFIINNCDGPNPLFLLCLRRRSRIDDEKYSLDVKENYADTETLELAPMSQDGCRSMIRCMLCSGGRGAPRSVQADKTERRIKKEVEDVLLKYSQGNPFYLEELVLSTVESGSLIEADGEWRLAGEVDALRIPSSLSSLVRSRIDLLDPIHRQGLQRASVIGVEVMQSIYHWVAHRLALEEDQELTISELEVRDFLRRFAFDPEVTYLFKHILTRTIAYETLLVHNRRILHKLTAEAIEELFLDELERFSCILAHHYHVAGDRGKAIEWGMKALTQCRRHYDNLEAIAWADRMTRLLNEEPDSEERDKKLLEVWRSELRAQALLRRSDDRQKTLERMMALGEKRGFKSVVCEVLGEYGVFYHQLGDTAKAEDYCRRALDLARKLGDEPREGIVLINLAALTARSGDQPQKTADYYEQSLEIQRKTGSRDLEGGILLNLGNLKLRLGMLNDAAGLVKESLALARDLGNPILEGAALNSLGDIYEQQGQIDEALRHFRLALNIHREVGNRQREANSLAHIGKIYAKLGGYDEALSYYEQALAVAEETCDRSSEGMIRFWMGLLFADRHQYDQALEQYISSLKMLVSVKNRRGEGMVLTNLAMLLHRQGGFDDVLRHLETALTIHRQTGNRQFEAVTLDALGLLHHHLGHLTEASRLFHQALEILAETGDRSSEGQTLANLGSLQTDLGNLEEASENLGKALAISRELKEKRLESQTLENNGWWHLRSEQWDKAALYFNQSSESYRASGKLDGFAMGKCAAASSYLALGEIGKAGGALDEVEEFIERGDNPMVKVIYNAVRGRLSMGIQSMSPVLLNARKGGVEKDLLRPLDYYLAALKLVEQLHLGKDLYITRDFSRLRLDLLDAAVDESNLPLPSHWS